MHLRNHLAVSRRVFQRQSCTHGLGQFYAFAERRFEASGFNRRSIYNRQGKEATLNLVSSLFSQSSDIEWATGTAGLVGDPGAGPGAAGDVTMSKVNSKVKSPRRSSMTRSKIGSKSVCTSHSYHSSSSLFSFFLSSTNINTHGNTRICYDTLWMCLPFFL